MKIHFIGVGGIGVSALAQYYLEKGHEVSGSDLATSEITEFLEKKGVKVTVGNLAENIAQDLDLVVYSPAVKNDNPELEAARKFQISNFKFQILSYPEALGELTKEYFTIAVSGSHGKSTTTAMIALVLIKAGLDPVVIVGTKLKEFGDTNFRMGKSKYLVIEACEYDSSFLHYSPQIIVVTNIDKEHLDYFKTFTNVKKAFKNFIAKLPEDGFLVFNKKPTMNQKEAKKIKKILKVPGNHNVFNAKNALDVARILKIEDEITFSALLEFTGTWRRFEERQVQISNFKFQIISDYAHHPNEILATLKAAREKYKNPSARLRAGKIWCIFQPHQRQRTHYLFNDFVKVFRNAKINNIIITDIYDVAGRETKKISAETSSEKLVKKINKKNVEYLPMDNLENFIKENIKSGDVLIIMGAGDIYKLSEKF